MTIKLFEAPYRDDLIFMVLQAKDALGRKPSINEDLLDIQSSYFDRGDKFWIAIDTSDRVIGCVGFNRIPNTTEAFLHRLYVKPSEKHKGIGTALLRTAEKEMYNQEIKVQPLTQIEIDMINESSRFMKLNSPYTKNEISGNCETDF